MMTRNTKMGVVVEENEDDYNEDEHAKDDEDKEGKEEAGFLLLLPLFMTLRGI